MTIPPSITRRKAEQANNLAELAAELTNNQDARILYTLSVAYAAADQFDRAATAAQAALAVVSADQTPVLADQIRKQLDIYLRKARSRGP